jgi:predicted nucleotidyltransferase
MTTAATQDAIRKRYQDAVESLLTKLKQDQYVIAVILYGSVAYDVVWEKSDIDMHIVIQDTKSKPGAISMVEDGINVHAGVSTRSDFKKELEGTVQGSFIHSMLMKGQLLFTRDESLEALWENRHHFGDRDRAIRVLQAAIAPVTALPKAHKWLTGRNDPRYAYFWVTACIYGLANIETVLAGDIPTREVIQQALQHNPTLFHSLYTDLTDSPKTSERVGLAISQIEVYLRERATTIFRPIFDYLEEEGAPRSVREISFHFEKHLNLEGAFLLCEWLSDEGFIQKVAVPARLTDKSKVDVEETAFYYDGSPS